MKPFTEKQIQDKIGNILMKESSRNSELKWTKKVIQEIAEKSCGDMRSAIQQTELFSRGGIKKQDEKDNYLTIHHAVGRILYGKNEPGDLLVNQQVHTTEDILISYVHHNTIEFCESVDDISNIFEEFSFSDIFFSKYVVGEKLENEFKYTGYEISFRGYLLHNKNFTEKKFKPIKAPLIKQTDYESRNNFNRGIQLFPNEYSGNLFIESIPFFKRLPKSLFNYEQFQFFSSIHNYDLRNGLSRHYQRIKTGNDEDECKKEEKEEIIVETNEIEPIFEDEVDEDDLEGILEEFFED